MSDRLYLSCVNTVAYLVTREKNKQLAKEYFIDLLPLAIRSDNELQNNTNNISAILEPKTVRIAFSSTRPELDDLESPKARDFATWGYALIPKLFPGIKSFIIENQDKSGKWKNKYELAMEILTKTDFIPSLGKDTPDPLHKHLKNQRLKLVTPSSFLNTFYEVPDVLVSEIIGMEESWKKISLLYNEESIEKFGKEKKAYLDEVETNLSSYLEQIMTKFNLSNSKIKSLNNWPLKAINRLIVDYSNGHLLPFVKYVGDKVRYGNGYLNLLETLASQ